MGTTPTTSRPVWLNLCNNTSWTCTCFLSYSCFVLTVCVCVRACVVKQPVWWTWFERKSSSVKPLPAAAMKKRHTADQKSLFGLFYLGKVQHHPLHVPCNIPQGPFNALEFDDFTIKKKCIYFQFLERLIRLFGDSFLGSQIFAICKNPSESNSLVCSYRREHVTKGDL